VADLVSNARLLSRSHGVTTANDGGGALRVREQKQHAQPKVTWSITAPGLRQQLAAL
jgi:hypothetical protein